MKSFETHGGDDTIALGRRLAHQLPQRGLVLLVGNLGAGKTTLAKGIVSERTGTPIEDITSPTFTLIHEYGSVYHIDLYRLETEQELARLGLEEILDSNALVLVEWGERFPSLVAATQCRIELRAGERDVREVTLSTDA